MVLEKIRAVMEFLLVFCFIAFFALVALKYYSDAIPGITPPRFSFDKYVNEQELLSEIKAMGIEKNAVLQGATNTVPIINYHGITPLPTSGSVTVQQFKEQMLALKKAGYNTVKLNDFYLFMQGKKRLPEKSFLITFDDGRKDSYYNSYYVLKDLNYTAVMFVIAYYSIETKSQYYLSLDELKQMDASGIWEIQEHAFKGHGQIIRAPDGDLGSFYGNKEWLAGQNRLETDSEYEARIKADLDAGKALLEKEFRKPVYAFALPFGDYGQNTSNDPNLSTILSDILKQRFSIVFYQYKPSADVDYRANYNDKSQDFYFAVRNSVSSDYSAGDLLGLVNASQERSLPYIETFSNSHNWVRSWGAGFEAKNKLVISAETGKTALAYIDGSYLWKDYVFSATSRNDLNIESSLVVRFKDSFNYAVCNFTNERVFIELVSNNRHSIIAQRNFTGLENSPLYGSSVFGAKAFGDSIECLLNGNAVLDVNSAGLPPNGGAGIKFGSFDKGRNSTTITAASVLPVSAEGAIISQ